LKKSRIRIVFRADGNSHIGLGHIYRCIAMVQMLKYEFNCLFIINNPDENISDLIRGNCLLHTINVQSKEEEITALDNILTPSDIVVTDGYDFGPEYQMQLKQRVKKLVMIDDMADMHFFADVVINHGSESMASKYKTEKGTKLLVGFDYLVLRQEFLEAARKHRTVYKANNAFICMGGSDPFKITTKALKACIETPFIERITVITGSGYQDRSALDLLIKTNTNKSIVHKYNIDAPAMVGLINECEIAICPSSTIALEVCCVHTGLLSGTVADNQEAIHRQIVDADCCLSAGNLIKASIPSLTNTLRQFADVNLIRTMMTRQAEKIDGQSGKRIADLFRQLAI